MKNIDVRAAMPGNPSFYENGLQDYSIEALKKLKEHGINTVFINLAWSRPYIDVVCLEHFAISATYPLMSDLAASDNRKKLLQRLHNVKKLGLKAMILAGLPMSANYDNLPDKYQVLKGSSVSQIGEWALTCISSPEVMHYYKELLEDVLLNLPELDGMLVYTYDELAEVCDEDSDCPRCHGIPQEIRIAKFLNELNVYVKKQKSSFEIWWEPWELTWTQVYGTLERLDKNIAVACHSTLHEVYFANHPDLWLRSIAALCKEQGRRMIVELFMGGTGEDTGFTPSYPCPRLVYEQIDRAIRTEGVTGIKEYYGLCPEFMSVNEAVMKAAFTEERELPTILEELAERYCLEGKENLLSFWELGSRVLEIFPWELSWVMRQYNYHPYDISYWGKVDFFDLMKTPWTTPAWQSNRRSYYVISHDKSNMSVVFEKELQKRFHYTEALLERGLSEIEKVTAASEYKKDLDRQKESVRLFLLFTRCRMNHLEFSLEQKRIRDGWKDKTRILIVLEKEERNAENMIDLLEHSEIPYLLSTDKIRTGLEEIRRFRTEIVTSEGNGEWKKRS